MTEPSITESMIEAGAEACYAAYSRNRVAEWDDIEDDHRALYRRDARAVLTAALAVAPDEDDDPTELEFLLDEYARSCREIGAIWAGATGDDTARQLLEHSERAASIRERIEELAAVAPEPADDDDLASLEPTLVYQTDPVALYAYPVAESVLFVEEINGGRSNRLFIPAMYCDAVIDALLAGKPEREKRLAFLRETFPEADSLERAVSECEARGWDIELESDIQVGRSTVYHAYVSETVTYETVGRGKADMPLLALRAAMTAADGREEAP